MRNLGKRRRSHAINRYPAVNIHHARRCSELWGTPLNLHVSIHLSQCGFHADDASEKFQKLISERFSPWLRRLSANDNGTGPTYIWTLEAPNEGVGVHWLLHLPTALHQQFKRKLPRWIESLGGSPQPRSIKVGGIDRLIGLTRYVLKGISSVWGAHLGVIPVYQGEIVGKRTGFSRNLGPAERTRRGYKPKRHLN